MEPLHPPPHGGPTVRHLLVYALALVGSLAAFHPAPTAAAPPKPAKPHPNMYMVQVRAPGYRTFAIHPNAAAAHAHAHKLHRSGWTPHVKKHGAGYLVRARITRWRTV